MSRNITIGLSATEVDNLISELEAIEKKLAKIETTIVDNVAEYGLDRMQKNFSESQYQPVDGVGFAKVGTERDKSIKMIGTQVIYHEFGTGTMGQNDPHPQKNMFTPGLKDYNSGRTIRKNKNPNGNASLNGIPLGELYWTYTQDGEKIYTQGIPSQKTVFKTMEDIKSEMPNILKQSVEEVLK